LSSDKRYCEKTCVTINSLDVTLCDQCAEGYVASTDNKTCLKVFEVVHNNCERVILGDSADGFADKATCFKCGKGSKIDF